jgi:hypothetical protein
MVAGGNDMQGYLGEFDVDVGTTPYAAYTASDWAMEWIGLYGQFEGDHHKAWVLDQVARILKGTPVIVKQARWDNGHSEYRLDLDEPSKNYKKWVKAMRGKWDKDMEEYEYGYDEGIAP